MMKFLSVLTSVTLLPSCCYGSLMPSFFRLFTTLPLSFSSQPPPHDPLHWSSTKTQEKLGIILLNLGGPEKQEVSLSSHTYHPLLDNVFIPVLAHVMSSPWFRRMFKVSFIIYLLIQISFDYQSFLVHSLLFKSLSLILFQRIVHPNQRQPIKALGVGHPSTCSPKIKPRR